ncbi:MAG: HlyD family efflux transporter periplasmic adaptor subunit [Bacillota bacterium]|nr:HlyD family efflux transporter periplasmic adaptor subunit [Bacillota bacterium]
MSRGFKLFGLALINILFMGLLAIKPVSASEDKSPNKVIEATKGDYIEKGAVMNAEMVFLRNDGLAIKESEASFIEYLVEDGQIVEKGDRLLSYRIPFDYIAVEEKKLALQLNKKNYDLELRRREAQIAENRSFLQEMDQTTIDAQILNLSIIKMEIAYEQFRDQSEKEIRALQEEIQDMELDSDPKYIYAPYDGMVETDDNISEDQQIGPNMELVRIYDVKSAVLVGSAAGANKLWYNLDVSASMVSSRQENKGKVYKGKVISIDSVLDNKASTGMVFIKLDDESLYSTISKANISADAVYLHNVFVLPLDAVNFNNEERFIYYYDETGDIHKQYITGRNNGLEMWVYDGLTEGQKIIVD